jgi:hypothetical protein
MSLRHSLPLLGTALALLVACSGAVDSHGGGPGGASSTGGNGSGSGGSGSGSGSGGIGSSGSGSSSGNASSSGGATSAYPGHGFVVHEWGTDTVVVGSDGSLQRGLHHEEEDLPAFVYDRVKAGRELGQGSPSVEIKMETPVTYFYSDKPLAVTASVDFPKGILTQWYPAVTGFLPAIAGPSSEGASLPADYADPTLDVTFTFQSPTCRDHYTQIAGGRLDWGSVELLDRTAQPALPDAPVAQYSWSFARQVASNPVRTAGGQVEQFLFYRGLGNFDPPAHVTAASGGSVTIASAVGETLGSVFVLNVGASTGAFTVHPEGIAAGASLTDVAPALDGAPSLDAYAQALGDAIVQALDGAGLYHDESLAMVATWKRQWFRTPGVRLLYLAPQSWTDASIPLTLQPKPDATTRVMMMRVEVITPELEAADVKAAQLLAAPSTAQDGQAYFVGLGRFAEPRLRRALALLGSPSYGDALLSQIATAATDVSSGE